MTRYIRMNTYLGTAHEIPEKQALRKINSRWWVRHWDSYFQEPTNMWINTRDMARDVIFKVDEDGYSKWEKVIRR